MAHVQSHVFAELDWSRGYARLLVRLDLKEVMSDGAVEEVPWEYTQDWVKGLDARELDELCAKLVARAKFLVIPKEKFSLEPDPSQPKEIIKEENFFKAAEGEVLLSLKVSGDPKQLFSISSSLGSGKPLMLLTRRPPPQASAVEFFLAGTPSNQYPLSAMQAAGLVLTDTPEAQLARGLIDWFWQGWRAARHWWPLAIAFILARQKPLLTAGTLITIVLIITQGVPFGIQAIYHESWAYVIGSMISTLLWTLALFFLMRVCHGLLIKRWINSQRN